MDDAGNRAYYWSSGIERAYFYRPHQRRIFDGESDEWPFCHGLAERQMALDVIPILADGIKWFGYLAKIKNILESWIL